MEKKPKKQNLIAILFHIHQTGIRFENFIKIFGEEEKQRTHTTNERLCQVSDVPQKVEFRRSLAWAQGDWGKEVDASIAHNISMEKYLIPVIKVWISDVYVVENLNDL